MRHLTNVMTETFVRDVWRMRHFLTRHMRHLTNVMVQWRAVQTFDEWDIFPYVIWDIWHLSDVRDICQMSHVTYVKMSHLHSSDVRDICQMSHMRCLKWRVTRHLRHLKWDIWDKWDISNETSETSQMRHLMSQMTCVWQRQNAWYEISDKRKES